MSAGDVEALEHHLVRQIEHSRTFFWHRLRWRAVRRRLPAGEPFELVDVGAGAGLLGDYLAADRPRASYRFVEPLPALASYLAERFGAGADANDERTYEAARFVTLLDVLEHQEDDVRFLAELGEKMAPGALLILTVPAMRALWSEWDTALGHYRRYDKRRLRAALRDAPLIPLEISYLFPEMVLPGLLRRGRPAGDAEFPDLPAALNSVLYGAGAATQAARRIWPAGSSLLLVAQRMR